jgi:hypothetical protein
MPEGKELLKAFLYDLARDCMPIGEINRILLENTKLSGAITYSDPLLAEWADKAAKDLLLGVRYAEKRKVPCAGPGCANYRKHWECPDEPRGTQYVEVDEDYEGLAFCSLTCALLAGAIKLHADPK